MEERIIKDINDLLAQLFQKMKEAGYEWDDDKKELKKIEQMPQRIISAEAKEAMYDKPWSEDDENMLNLTLGLLSYHRQCRNWLKSLKERVLPQNIACYNPYKEVVESIAEMCKHYDKASHSGLRDFYDNVKVKCKDAKEYESLYPQSTFKPSDEQMKVLLSEVTAWSKGCHKQIVLESLYQDLKKLREE